MPAPPAPPSPAHRPPLSWTAFVGAGLRISLARRAKLLSDTDHWSRHTAAIQLSQLRTNLTAAARTSFGIEHDFPRLLELPDDQLIDAYRAAVPLGDYEAYRDHLDTMRTQGQPNVLWPGTVCDFCQTSGTTAGDKYIPLTDEMFRSNQRAAFDIFAHAIRFGISLPRLLSGKALFLGGSTTVTTNEHGIRTGDLSGLVTKLIHWPLSQIYSPGPDIALMDHWPSKIDAMAKLCLMQDVRMVNGMPSWAHVLFERILELAEDTGARCIRDIWPNLMLFVHGGVRYEPFRQRIIDAYSQGQADIPNRIELYPASEGFIAIQDIAGDPGLRLLTDIGNFYEFIPLEEIHNPSARAFTCDQVEPGQRYVVTMSTCAGLYRYVIGDVVEFDASPRSMNGSGGWAANPAMPSLARLRIVGRHRHFINAFGENIIVEHIENAVSAAAAEAGITPGEFTAAPVYPDHTTPAGLELVIEIPSPVDADQIVTFRDAFDRTLKAQNVDYTTKRTDSLGMAPPTITPVAPGTFHAWLASRGKLGGQHKCPRCANNRDNLESVLAIATDRYQHA